MKDVGFDALFVHMLVAKFLLLQIELLIGNLKEPIFLVSFFHPPTLLLATSM
jgi:hypothetical protein